MRYMEDLASVESLVGGKLVGCSGGLWGEMMQQNTTNKNNVDAAREHLIVAAVQLHSPLSDDASSSSKVLDNLLLLLAKDATTTRQRPTLASARNICMRRALDPVLVGAEASGTEP